MMPPAIALVALALADGSVALMQFVTTEFNADGSVRRAVLASSENVQAEIDRSPLQVTSWRFVQPDAVPADRTYRNAWTLSGETIVHDLDKAKETHKNILRGPRAGILSRLDVAYMRADEAGDLTAKATIRAAKKRLRDLTVHPDLLGAADLDTLRKVGFDVLADANTLATTVWATDGK